MATTTYHPVVEELAARQWARMTRSTVPFDALTESDKDACRALVLPILRDVAYLAEAAAAAGDPADEWLAAVSAP